MTLSPLAALDIVDAAAEVDIVIRTVKVKPGRCSRTSTFGDRGNKFLRLLVVFGLVGGDRGVSEFGNRLFEPYCEEYRKERYIVDVDQLNQYLDSLTSAFLNRQNVVAGLSEWASSLDAYRYSTLYREGWTENEFQLTYSPKFGVYTFRRWMLDCHTSRGVIEDIKALQRHGYNPGDAINPYYFLRLLKAACCVDL